MIDRPLLLSRRDALKYTGLTGAGTLLGHHLDAAAAVESPVRVTGKNAEIDITGISPHTVRLTIRSIEDGGRQAIPTSGSLVKEDWGTPSASVRVMAQQRTINLGGMSVTISPGPLSLSFETKEGKQVQRIHVEEETGRVFFAMGDGPVLGLGEGGRQFDRRESVDLLKNGQGGYELRTHGARVGIPWLIGTAGWAIFFHQPFGTFDLTGEEGRFDPVSADKALPLDLFLVDAKEPSVAMTEYARITGHPEMPPLWSLGYQQSHRTLASREEILSIARTFREKRLPCDALIYLGTGFCPSGWNTANGSFSFNRNVFPDPKEMFDTMHAEHFRVVLHAVILTRVLQGTVRDGCELLRFDEEKASCYWDMHRLPFSTGVDGWWPDEGDPLDIASRLDRNRMYWDGPQTVRPNERPYALHRNGYAGMQRYASFLWSGDVFSTWETLKTQIPIAVNTGLSGVPYWGTDTGGFVPTKEYTGELYVRWFQFSAFCPLFRSHGRSWKLHLPWGWNTGEIGPAELTPGTADPDPSELHNAAVEPICKKYLELRYRMLPYLYSVVRECHQTGMPIIRALWLHYPDDPVAVARGDEYLWGRDVLVAPVTEKGAKSRDLYLPAGAWYDFWTEERMEGQRQIARPVDLETLPLYVRAGAVLPFGPVKQYVGEKVDGPLELVVYPGADGEFLVYDDDGISFDYRRGTWMRLQIRWHDQRRTVEVRLAAGSRMLPPLQREIKVRLAGKKESRAVRFGGGPVTVQM